MSSKSLKNVQEIVDELMLHYGAGNVSQLSKELGYKSNAVAKWLDRESVPVEQVSKMCPELNPKFLQGQDVPLLKPGHRKRRSSHRAGLDRFSPEELIDEYKSRKEEGDFSEAERDLLYEVLLENAESLAVNLRRLIEIERNRSQD